MSISTNPIAGDLPTLTGQLAVPAPDVLEKVLQATQSLFAGPVQVEADSDPEDPSAVWWNIWVECSSDHTDLRGLRHQWHEAIQRISQGDPTKFSLQVRRR